ncbi:MAG: hypothetical protein AB7O47_12230 [Flavobacteriales bacterium]
MHQKYIGLIELIKSLSPVEKAYFKKFKAIENDDSRQLQLFELCIKHEHMGSEKIENMAIKTFTKKGYHQLKKLLFHSICDIMCYYNRNKQDRIKYYYETQKINFLISQNLKKEAAKYAYKLRKELCKTPFHSLISTLYGIENFVYFESQEADNFCESLKEHFNVNEVIKGMKELNDSRIYLYSLYFLNKNNLNLSEKNKVMLKTITDYYENEYADDAVFYSKQAELNHLNSLAVKETTSSDHQIELAIKQLQLIKNNLDFFTTDALLYSYNYLIVTGIKLNHHDEVEPYLKELELCPVRTQAQEKIKYSILYDVLLKYSATKNEMEEIRKTVDRYYEEKEQFTFKFPKIYDAEIAHYLLFANIFTANTKNNKKLIIEYATTNLRKNNPELYEVYRVLEILNLIELEDFDAVTYKIRNAKLAFKEKNSLYGLICLIDKVKNKLEVFDDKETEKIIEEGKLLYHNYYQNDNSHLVFSNFDLSKWFKLKLNKM